MQLKQYPAMTRLPNLLVLFLLLHASFCASLPEPIRGVAPLDQVTYVTEISCVVGGRVKILSLDRVNDEFCDCDDGQDEPGTAACSHVLSAQFHCENNGYFPEKIHTSRLHDGICDCCDGSDEELGGKILCPNSCAATADTFRKEAEQWLKVVTTGFEKRQAVVLKKVAAYFESEKRAQTKARKELAGLKVLKQRATMHKDREELVEKNYRIKVARQKQAIDHEWETTNQDVSDAVGREDEDVADFQELDALQVASEYVPEPLAEDELAMEVLDSKRETIKSLIKLPDGTQVSLADFLRMDHKDHTFSNRGAPRTVEEMRREDSRGLLFNGRADGRKRMGLYVLRMIGVILSPARAGVEIVLFCPRTLWNTLSSLEPIRSVVDALPNVPYPSHSTWFRRLSGGSVYDGYSSVMWGARAVWDAPVYAFNYLFPKLDDELKLPVAESLRTVLSEIDADIAKLENEQHARREAAKIDYGPDRAFFALKDNCIEKHIEKYVYKFCAFGEVKQDSTTLGKWAGWATAEINESSLSEASDKVDYTKMQYSTGQRCYNGPDRSVLVHLQCGTDDQIESVDEPSTCVYEMLVRTPLACSTHVLAKAQKDVTFWTQRH